MRSISDIVADAMAAVDARDIAEAEASGIGVDELRRQRGAWRIEAAEADRRAKCAENLAPYRGLIRPDDFARIVAGKLDSGAWKAVDAWLASPTAFLILRGGKGTGKTVATLAAIGRIGGSLLTSLEMARAWKQEHAEAQQLRASAIGSRLLVIDDLGTEPDRASGAVAFQELVNRRQGGVRTIITTNLSREQMTTAYDERTIDRLRHGGVMVSLRGESMRGGGHAGQ